jgi:hypothetical protein
MRVRLSGDSGRNFMLSAPLTCRSRRQADGLVPIMRRNTLLKCAWSHIPHPTATWERGSIVVLIIVHASSTRRLAM